MFSINLKKDLKLLIEKHILSNITSDNSYESLDDYIKSVINSNYNEIINIVSDEDFDKLEFKYPISNNHLL